MKASTIPTTLKSIINISNAGVKRAIDVISYENVSPEEWEQAKIEVGKRKVITLEREEERREIATNLKLMGISVSDISKATGMTIDAINDL